MRTPPARHHTSTTRHRTHPYHLSTVSANPRRDPRPGSNPDVDCNLGAVCGWAATVKRARVLLPVREAIVEHDRRIDHRRELHLQLGEGGPAAPLVGDRIEVDE